MPNRASADDDLLARGPFLVAPGERASVNVEPWIGPHTGNALAQANLRDWFQSQAPPRFEPRPFSKWLISPSRKIGCHTTELTSQLLRAV